MKQAVVSFADDAGSYRQKMIRFEQSLKGNFEGDFYGFTDYKMLDCEPHLQIPYKFKAKAMEYVRNVCGAEVVLWGDAKTYAKKSIQPIFDHIKHFGYLFFDNIGYSLGDYTNDKTLQYFGITREESWEIPMIMACVMGWNFTDQSVCDTFKAFADCANELYPGSWDNKRGTESADMRVKGHRHDQSVMSCIIHKEKLQITNAQQTFFAYEEHRLVMPIAQSVCLFAAG